MRYFIFPLYLLCLFFTQVSAAEIKNQAAIASAHPLATEAGFEILNLGGNAFDAAVAVSAVLAVVEPAGSGLGGGGFWLLHRANDDFQIMVDGRETAPQAAHRDMYLDEYGHVNKRLSLDGALAAAIPGVPAALDHISHKYGRLPLSKTLAPAIRYARYGFEISEHYQKLAGFRITALTASPEASTTFLHQGQVPKIGHRIIQTNLALTLEQIATHGRAGFYQGDIAKKLVAGVQQAGGLWTAEDLLNYRVKERAVIEGNYLGYKITSAAPPSSGGIVLTTMLNQLEQLPYNQANDVLKRHFITEVMRRAYLDRSRYLGDTDFIQIPPYLSSKDYAKTLADSINPLRASTSSAETKYPPIKGEDTTHFSIIDHQGNRVAATLSINYPFGSGFVPKGTGVLLNDEMDDFSAQPGSANVYGLVGNGANAIEANKRPLSSMTPTFIENDEQLMVIGTPGGSRIITMVLLGLLDFIDGKTAQAIVSKPRFHHQYLPDVVQIEATGFSEQALSDLERRGHKIERLNRRYGNMQVIIHNKQTKELTAASDPRGEGMASVRIIPHN